MASAIPAEFAALTVRREGERGARWIESLPDVVEALLHRWQCVLDGTVRHGQVGLVVPVLAPEGPAVMKVSPPLESNRGEAAVLRHLGGRSAVRLYREDAGSCAMLLERADGPPPATSMSVEESVEMMGSLAARLAIPFPSPPARLADTAAGWREEVEQRARSLEGLVGPRALARARRAIAVVAEDTVTTVVHGDLHEGNVLGSDRERWLAIDPKGWTGTAAYDGWTVALTRFTELRLHRDPAAVLRRRLTRFARAAHVDEDLTVEIAHARAVSSLLYEAATSGELFGMDLLRVVVG